MIIDFNSLSLASRTSMMQKVLLSEPDIFCDHDYQMIKNAPWSWDGEIVDTCSRCGYVYINDVEDEYHSVHQRVDTYVEEAI